ncbi:unnamed protein product [Orchesella dallaii]|uniref:Uncharacterized protein n=1 Tax=Orchesella dallaii TaxID=48710 RepID=A0ABP1R740_9HEXA
MIPMNSSIRKRINKEEVPDSGKRAEELASGSKSNPSVVGGSAPPTVFSGIGFQITTQIMQIPTKSLLQQPASAPPLRPILPTSHLLFSSLASLETEGLIFLDPEPEPLIPSPGEPQNWSHYGVYLQDLSAYNATGIKIPENISSATNSANRSATSSSTPTFPKAGKATLTLPNLITKESKSKPLKDKAKLGSGEKKGKRRVYYKEWYARNKGKRIRNVVVLTEEQKANRRAISKRWYERNKDKLKGRIIVLTEEQKVKRRAISKRWYDRNKEKLKGKVVVLTEEQREKVRAKSRLRYQAKKKLIAQQRKAELEEESSMSSSSSSSSTEAETQTRFSLSFNLKKWMTFKRHPLLQVQMLNHVKNSNFVFVFSEFSISILIIHVEYQTLEAHLSRIL